MTGHPVYAPILVAWARGPSADLLAGLSSTAQVDRALDALTRLLGEPRALIDRQPVTWATQDWGADPFARGAYSYVRAGGRRRLTSFYQPCTIHTDGRPS